MKHFLQAAAVAGGLALACVAGPAFAATMQCTPGQQITTAYPSGSTYTADAAGVVVNVSAVDGTACINLVVCKSDSAAARSAANSSTQT